MIGRPLATPLTTPVVLMLACAGVALLHVPPAVALACADVAPTHTSVVPVIAATVGVPLTVNERVALTLPQLLATL